VATTTRITRVVGNRGRAFGSPSRRNKRSKKRAKHAARRNTGEILAYTLATGNPGRKAKRKKMAIRKRKLKFGSAAWRAKYAHKRKRTNPGRRRRHHAVSRHRRRSTRPNPGRRSNMRRTHRRNPGEGNINSYLTNATFAIVGAIGSRLGAQLILGANNTGPVGYIANLAVGGAGWWVAEKVMKNREAAKGILTGTLIGVILRLLNDYTPFGQYLNSWGMGDYQVQGFVNPQILVDPTNNSQVLVPTGWGGAAALPSGAAASPVMAGGNRGGMGAASYDDGGLFGQSSY